QGAAGVKSRGLLRSDGQIIDHQFRGGIFQFVDYLFASGFFFERKERAQRILVVHVRRVTVENAAHFYNGAGELDLFTESLGAIRRRENGLANVQTDLAAIDVKRGHDLDVARAVPANVPVHQANAGAIGRGAIIKIDSLDKRAGTISNSHNGDSYFSHF